MESWMKSWGGKDGHTSFLAYFQVHQKFPEAFPMDEDSKRVFDNSIEEAKRLSEKNDDQGVTSGARFAQDSNLDHIFHFCYVAMKSKPQNKSLSDHFIEIFKLGRALKKFCGKVETLDTIGSAKRNHSLTSLHAYLKSLPDMADDARHISPMKMSVKRWKYGACAVMTVGNVGTAVNYFVGDGYCDAVSVICALYTACRDDNKGDRRHIFYLLHKVLKGYSTWTYTGLMTGNALNVIFISDEDDSTGPEDDTTDEEGEDEDARRRDEAAIRADGFSPLPSALNQASSLDSIITDPSTSKPSRSDLRRLEKQSKAKGGLKPGRGHFQGRRSRGGKHLF